MRGPYERVDKFHPGCGGAEFGGAGLNESEEIKAPCDDSVYLRMRIKALRQRLYKVANELDRERNLRVETSQALERVRNEKLRLIEEVAALRVHPPLIISEALAEDILDQLKPGRIAYFEEPLSRRVKKLENGLVTTKIIEKDYGRRLNRLEKVAERSAPYAWSKCSD